MGSGSKKVEIEVKANVTGEESVGTLGHALDSTGDAAKKLGANAGGAAGGVNAADGAAKGFTATSGKLRDGLESVSVQLDKAKAELLSLVGVGVGVQGLKDVSALADGYKNLEARIKLTTGEGKAFDTAFEGVFDVAKRTNSAVEETGVLFTKLGEAGKTLGVSNAEALKLTETINQSIQLSGASAEASKASITQLVQGLQSGVLRGDEFNSVMEQSPRLAKALADGLGVGTGELRKMAEAGQLTSATIIKALQGQSEAVQAEFSKLPATVGRAMTNLTTSFTAYVGEADKAGGYTAKLAHLIDGLAGNLSTVATVMIHTGQVVGAMKLLSMAQDWIAASTAIKATADSTEIATASTIKGTAAKVQNTTATVANTAAQVTNAAAARANTVTYDTFGTVISKQTPALTGNAKAWGELAAGVGGAAPKLAATGEAAASAAPKIGVMGAAVGGLMRTFAPLLALDVVLNFKSYGTAIGEWAAKMAGAKDRSAELAASEKRAAQDLEESTAARKRNAAAIKDAADRTFGLTKQGAELVTKFDEMRTKGDSAATAIATIGKDFDLSTAPGIRNAAAVLDKLAADGKLTATEVQAAWADALKGQDLAKFETIFRQAMLQVRADADKAGVELQAAIARGVSGKELDGFKDRAIAAMALATKEAERFEQAMGAKLQEAIKRTGLDFDVISGGMGKAAQSAINDTDAIISGLNQLKAQGVDTGQALAASLTKGINTADSVKALEAVRAQIESMRAELGKQVTDGLLDQAAQKAQALGDALDKVKPGVNSLREAMIDLGVVTDKTLVESATKAKAAYDAMVSSGTASVRELADGFKSYAEKAIAANNGVATAALKTEAAMRGVSIQTDSTGKAIVSSMAQGAAAIKTVEDAYHQLGLKTPEELTKIAAANTAAWDKVKGDANASVETLKAAFAAYAQSAAAAAGSVGSDGRRATEELLKQEATVKGLTVAFDAEGRMVVQTQAEAAAATAGTTEKLREQKTAVDAVTAAMEKENAALERKVSAQEKANDLKKREIDLENKRLNRDSEGFALDDQGKRRVESGNPIYSERAIFDMGKEKGLTESQALQVAAIFKGSQQVNEMGVAFGDRWMDKLTKAINDQVLENARAKSRAEAGQDRYGNPLPVAPTQAASSIAPTASVDRAPAASAQQGMGAINLTINVAPGVNMSSRADVEGLARAILPAVENLQRKGLRAG